MKFSSGSISHGRLGSWLVLLVVAFLAACGTISPRRIVNNNPSPTPTPTISPTPTPTATPTPTPMAAEVPAQFLFTADPAAGMILGFKINSDGGLSPVPGSPFELADSPRLLAAVGNHLFVAGNSTLTALAVNKETGAISTKAGPLVLASVSELAADPLSGTVFASVPNGQLAIRVVNDRIQTAQVAAGTAALGPSTATGVSKAKTAADATGKFVYVLDSGKGEISAFREQDGKPIPLSVTYPAGRGATSLTIAVP